jgi:hypothetical protein
MNALILPDIQNITKADAEEMFKPLVASVLNGETVPTDAQAFFTIVKKAIESGEGKIKPILIEEISKYKDGFNWRGMEFRIFNTGNRYDYSADPVIAELERRIESRKTLIKFANKNGEFLDVASGEVISPVPIKSQSQETVKVTIK